MSRVCPWSPMVGSLILSCLLATTLRGAVIDVDATVDDLSNNGNCTLREAIYAANFDTSRDLCTAGSGADTLRLPAGVYVVDLPGSNDNFGVDGDLDVRDSLTIEGADVELTIVDGASDERVFHVDPGNAGAVVTLRRLTVRNGSSADQLGGGIFNNGDLTLEDVVVSGNRTDGQAGGGIFNNDTLTLERVVLAGNSGDDGGALFLEGGSTATVLDSSFIGNSSATSAGAINNNGNLVVERSLLQGNVASTVKGGAIVNNDTMTLRHSTVTGNRAPLGAGGGIRNEGSLDLEYTTLAFNAAASGGAISNFDTVGVDHSILAENSPDNCADDPLVSGGFNLEDRDECGLGSAPIPDLVSTDPQLLPLQDNGGPTLTHALPAASPAVDVDDDVGCSDYDQRGARRPFDGDSDGAAACDIGDYELRPPLLVNTTADAVDAAPGDGLCETASGNGICTLRAAIQEANASLGLEDVVLPPGTYVLTIPGVDEDDAATGDLDIRDGLRVLGDAASSTVVDGGASDRVFDLVGVGVALAPGLPRWGVLLSDLTIRNGSATRGGGLRSDSLVLLRRVDVRQNQATWGGGVYLENDGRLLIRDSWVRDNQAANNGGGLHTEFATGAVLRRTTLSGNQAGGSGGGAEIDGEGTLENVTVSGNTSDNGGGLFTGRVAILSSTLTGNTATGGQGGGLFLIGESIFHNTILAGNAGGAGTTNCVSSGGVVFSRGYNLEGDDTCSLNGVSDLVNADPLLAPLSDQGGFAPTHPFLAGSPAVESGDPDVCPATDGRGLVRPVDGDNDGIARCDRGAFEAEIRRFSVDSSSDAVDAVPGDGVCATAAGPCTVRAAIQEANAWGGTDEVFLPPGVYTLGLVGLEDEAAAGDVDIRSSLILRGSGARSTIIDANGVDRVLDLRASPSDIHVTVEGVTLRNGFSGQYGAGIRASGSDIFLRLAEVALTDNTAAGSGGREGGGLYACVSELTVERSLFAGNVATDGGGLYLCGTGTAVVTDTTVSGNSATGSAGFGQGGGIYSGMETTLTNVTVTDNSADLEGGGLYRASSRTLIVDSSIVAGNANGNCGPRAPLSAGFNLEDGNDCDLNGGADLTSLIDTDPLLGSLADNGGPTDTHALLPGSLAIDGGHDPSCSAADQRGVRRPLDGNGDGSSRCDIGAYEVGLFGDGFESGDNSAWSSTRP